MSDKWAPEQSNIDTQIAIGRELRRRIPGQSPYDTVRKAAAQLYPDLGVSHAEDAPSRDVGAWSNDGGAQPGLAGTAHVNDSKLMQGAYGKLIPNPEDQQNFLTGVYAHEILGHGGDTWRSHGRSDLYPTLPNGATPGFLGHFQDEGEPQDPGKRRDDVSFLLPQVNKVLNPQLFEAQQALRDAQAKQEAARLGAPTELPSEAKAQTQELPGAGPQPVTDWKPSDYKQPFFPTSPSPYSVMKRLPSY